MKKIKWQRQQNEEIYNQNQPSASFANTNQRNRPRKANNSSN